MKRVIDGKHAHRKEIIYSVCCDCKHCSEVGCPFSYLDYYRTKQAARNGLKVWANEMGHNSCYLAKWVTTPIDEWALTKRKSKTRKAA